MKGRCEEHKAEGRVYHTWTQSTPVKNGWFLSSSEPPPTQPNRLSTSLCGRREGERGGEEEEGRERGGGGESRATKERGETGLRG